MSYCRFSDDSDVYVYPTVDGGYCCCGCGLKDEPSFYCNTPEMMIGHLVEHQQVGHKVPQRAIARLYDEVP